MPLQVISQSISFIISPQNTAIKHAQRKFSPVSSFYRASIKFNKISNLFFVRLTKLKVLEVRDNHLRSLPE